MGVERCVVCGLEFTGQERVTKADPEGLGRMNTSAGPVHFGCYWDMQREATNDALSVHVSAARG